MVQYWSDSRYWSYCYEMANLKHTGVFWSLQLFKLLVYTLQYKTLTRNAFLVPGLLVGLFGTLGGPTPFSLPVTIPALVLLLWSSVSVTLVVLLLP